jgi:hypothetical protein
MKSRHKVYIKELKKILDELKKGNVSPQREKVLKIKVDKYKKFLQ